MLHSSRLSEKRCPDTGEGPSLARRGGRLLCTGFVRLSADGGGLSPCPLLFDACSIVPGAKGAGGQPKGASLALNLAGS